MSRPGTTITRSETFQSRSARTGTGPGFMPAVVGTADAGGGPRVPARSLSEYATRFGSRAQHVNDQGGGAGTVYDSVEGFFRAGGTELYVSPAAFSATPAVQDTNIATAAGVFTRDLGPGQLFSPGRTTPAGHLALMQAARAGNRVALLDAPNTGTVSTLTAATTVAGATPEEERVTGLFAPFVTFTSGGVTRTIGPSAVVAGRMARNDAAGVSPNQPSAGANGEVEFLASVVQTFPLESDRATLNTNGVNLLRAIYDGVRIYGYRTLADPTSDSNWLSLANARLFMGIQAEADEIAERFVFRELDGQLQTIAEFAGALSGMLLRYWQRGSLFGLTPEDAFRVDVGEGINTLATMAAGELRAKLRLRTSPFAEEVILDLVKTRITEAL